jgi:hypothetical protein
MRAAPPRAKGRRVRGEGRDASRTAAAPCGQNMLTQHLLGRWATWYTCSEPAYKGKTREGRGKIKIVWR